jgi:hypothetical protein
VRLPGFPTPDEAAVVTKINMDVINASAAMVAAIDAAVLENNRERTRASQERCARAVERLLEEGTSITYGELPMEIRETNAGWAVHVSRLRDSDQAGIWSFYHNHDHNCDAEICDFEVLDPIYDIQEMDGVTFGHHLTAYQGDLRGEWDTENNIDAGMSQWEKGIPVPEQLFGVLAHHFPWMLDEEEDIWAEEDAAVTN